MIDFSQLNHEDLEFLAADLLRCSGFAIDHAPSRGPDQGKDLLAIRCVTDDLGVTDTERVLVQCKHLHQSGKSVRESDIGNFEARMKQHRANRYLLVTTTIPSQTVQEQFIAVSKDESSPRKAACWAKADLVGMLEEHPDICRKYFRSWQSEAEEAVLFVHKHLFPAHRGALLWCPDVTAVFGNDGYAHKDCQTEVDKLRTELSARSIDVLAFAPDEDEYSWVLLVASGDARQLNDLVWECSWVKPGHPIYELERSEAYGRLYSYSVSQLS